MLPKPKLSYTLGTKNVIRNFSHVIIANSGLNIATVDSLDYNCNK